jgi:hypothetical protein
MVPGDLGSASAKFLGENPTEGRRLDYWAVEDKTDGIDSELLGRYYALLTAQVHSRRFKARSAVHPAADHQRDRPQG